MSERVSLPLADLSSKVGEEVGVSDWFEIDQDKIDRFADLTGDHQFIHVNLERAKAETPFGGTIAHGFLTLSLMTAMAENCLPSIQGVAMGINYGSDKIRFISPVRSGSRVRGRFTLSACEEKKPGEVAIVWSVIVEIEGQEKPALAAEWLSRQYLKQ